MLNFIRELGLNEETLDARDVRQERYYTLAWLVSLTENIEVDDAVGGLTPLKILWQMVIDGRPAPEWAEFGFDNLPDIVVQEWVIAQRISEGYLLNEAEMAPELLSEEARNNPK